MQRNTKSRDMIRLVVMMVMVIKKKMIMTDDEDDDDNDDAYTQETCMCVIEIPYGACV